LRHLLEEILPTKSSFQNFLLEQTFPHIGRRAVMLNGRRLEQTLPEPGRILLAMEEVKAEEKAAE
jgi:two-component system CheB/CheR fusion protein